MSVKTPMGRRPRVGSESSFSMVKVSGLAPAWGKARVEWTALLKRRSILPERVQGAETASGLSLSVSRMRVLARQSRRDT